jgi:ketosteroid isomerase-like protein
VGSGDGDDRRAGASFDFDAYRAAFEAKDVAPWLAFYADDAEWLEYRHSDPPRAPSVMRGKAEIGAFLERVAALPLTIELSREVLAADRIAFACLVTFDDGKQILEHVIADLREGRIVRHVEVEAWD